MTHFRMPTYEELTPEQRNRVVVFLDYLKSEVCELDLLDGPTEEWADRSWDLSQRLDAETIKWLECGGDINA